MSYDEGYKKLIEGYKIGLSLLKQIKPKLYDKFMFAKRVLEEDGNQYSEMIRNLRVDFSQGNIEKEAEYPKIVTVRRLTCNEIYALSYSPQNDWALAILYEKHTVLGYKKVFCEIIPSTLKELKENIVTCVLRISLLDEESKVDKVYQYIAGIAEGALVVLKQDVDKQNKVKDVFEIELDQLDEIMLDTSKMF